MSLSNKAMLLGVVAAITVFPAAAFAGTASTPRLETSTTDQSAQTQTEAKRKTLMADATSAIRETENSLKLLDEGKKHDALAALERATGKLDIILAREPQLALAPAAINSVRYDFQGGIDDVRKVHKQIDDLIGEGRLQEARGLLRYLASETVISVTSVPLATYPDAIKNAVKLIDENKTTEARRALQAALDTQVVTETIVPLPVANAAESLKTAEALAEKPERTKEESANLKASLDKARSQLELAQAFGYGNRTDFSTLYQQLTEVEQKTAANGSGSGLFAKIKESISGLFKSSQAVPPAG